MTTVELVQHLLPLCRFRDAAETTAADAQELALVMSQAVEEWFALAPAIYRRTTVTRHQAAPAAMEIEIEARASRTIGTPFSAAQRGSSILFADDPKINEITGPGSLLHAYTGAGGIISAEVFGDCIPFTDFLVERMMTHPEAISASGRQVQLRPVSAGSRAIRLPAPPAAFMEGPAEAATRRRDRAPLPSHYWVEPVGGSHQVEVDAVFQVRVWPLPAGEWMMQTDAEVLPLPIRVGDLESTAELPVPDSMAHRTLVPLARGFLADSAVFAGDKSPVQPAALHRARERAEAQISALAPVFGPAAQYIGTPPGW